jgi:hypothetical protein
LPAEVSVQLKPEGRSDAAVRTALRTAASLEAVQQTLGSRVRSRSTSDISSERATGTQNKTASRFSQRIASQADGLVSLQVIEEAVATDGAVLRAKALVCIPRDPSALRETVSVGSLLSSRGEMLDDGVSALRQVFSNSGSFVLTDSAEEADWIIEGRIASVDVRAVVTAATAFSTKSPIVGTAPPSFQRLQVTGLIDARNEAGRHVTAAFDETRNIAQSQDAADILNQWAPRHRRKEN